MFHCSSFYDVLRNLFQEKGKGYNEVYANFESDGFPQKIAFFLSFYLKNVVLEYKTSPK